MVKEQFTGGDSDASLSPDKQRDLYGKDYQASGFNNPQAGGAKRRKTRSAKTKQKKNKKRIKVKRIKVKRIKVKRIKVF